ncbi:hypothetical protein C8R47DRAFT_1076817 [Mycena vitilis]|nr:hypothetical protein C8R47DRAFT_1076817 [Mycena vitilis]
MAARPQAKEIELPDQLRSAYGQSGTWIGALYTSPLGRSIFTRTGMKMPLGQRRKKSKVSRRIRKETIESNREHDNDPGHDSAYKAELHPYLVRSPRHVRRPLGRNIRQKMATRAGNIGHSGTEHWPLGHNMATRAWNIGHSGTTWPLGHGILATWAQHGHSGTEYWPLGHNMATRAQHGHSGRMTATRARNRPLGRNSGHSGTK